MPEPSSSPPPTTRYWAEVKGAGLSVPDDRPLADLTAELTRMLGDPDPQIRDGVAYPTLATWIERGVYDDLLIGLGDGMAAGLTVGLGERDTDTVFRRSFSVLILTECIVRDTVRPLVTGSKIYEWGDRISGWLLRERDIRGYVPGRGWAHALAHGADALAALGSSPHLGANELTVLLDVIADRILMPADIALTHGEPDRLALATVTILRRGLVPTTVVEPWISRVAAGANRSYPGAGKDPYLRTGSAEAFLRALYLQLALGARPLANRSDLLLAVVDGLRASNHPYLA
ncbi:MAG: DUF2785 domain-containing protein [Nocardioides sp.]|uniref:DUF2785 domain-containing protein n=1 Tax=Nocardioides sp. TaxID=35761 RepID=UPI0039E62767